MYTYGVVFCRNNEAGKVTVGIEFYNNDIVCESKQCDCAQCNEAQIM